MLYRCTSLARRSRAALQHQGQGQHGGRGSEKTSSVIHRHSRQAWAAAALQQLLIHVLECTRVAQRKGGVETPKSRASIAPEQTSEHSPRVQHLVDLTTRQSGRKDTRTGTYPTRFSLQAKSIRKTDADRIYNTHRHGKVPAPPEICEKSRKKKKKSDHREGLCDNQKKKKNTPSNERAIGSGSFVEGFHPAKSAASRTWKDEPAVPTKSSTGKSI